MLFAFYDAFLSSRNATLYFRVGRPSAERLTAYARPTADGRGNEI